MDAPNTIPECLGAPDPTAPSRPLPAGACDTHLHVLGPYARYPLAARRAYTVPESPLSALKDYMAITGLSRVVIAHVSAAGKRLDVTLDSIAELGEAARGTIMLEDEMDAARLADLHGAGIRGVRLSGAFGDALTADLLVDTARRIRHLGWHIAIWPSSASELQLFDRVAPSLGVPLVLDHLAAHCWAPDLNVDQPGFTALRRLLQGGDVWLKLSAMNRATEEAYPWPSLAPFASLLASEVPERLLWASDWPHVGLVEGIMPRSGEMLDWLDIIGCNEETRRRILVENPATLFGF